MPVGGIERCGWKPRKTMLSVSPFKMLPYPAVNKEEVFTMLNSRITALLLAFMFIFGSFAVAAQTVSPIANGAQIFPLSEIREGLKGKAWTVFRGTKPEEFNVEIFGVVTNAIGPKQDMIIGRLSGQNAERTFVFAGMSGSPVYIDGKLVGAISYSFPFAKEPICGITPFEQMASVMKEASTANASPGALRTFSTAELRADIWQPSRSAFTFPKVATGFASDSLMMAVAGQTFVPISTPVYFSGISQQALSSFAPHVLEAGIIPVASTGGSTSLSPMAASSEDTLLGGDSVVVHLSRGDVNVSAAGTVTLRDGQKIYAFGHPFFSLGATNLPMSQSHVVTVVPNVNNSFKLAVPDAMVGSMTQDRSTGIYGSLGQTPKMLPIKVKIRTSRGMSQEFNFESVIDELLTPLIISAGVGNALLSQERSVGDLTVELKGEIRVKGEQPIVLNRRFAGPQAPAFATSSVSTPVAALLRAGFEGADITGVDIDMVAIDGAKTASLERIELDKTQVRAGDTVEIKAIERTPSGSVIVQRIPLLIPADTQPGTLTVTLGDGNTVQQNAAVTQFTPRSAAELIATIGKLKRPDRLYAVLGRAGSGTIIGATELPNLPPSMLATINNDRSAGGPKSTTQTTIAEYELPFGEFLVSGSQNLTIEVVK